MLSPTQEQIEIINSLRDYDRVKVYAYAGTGKTTTLKMLTEYYSRYRFLYLAFNNSISKEARKKFPMNTDVRTTHSLAMNMVSSDININGNLINRYRVVDILDLYDDVPNYQIGSLILECFTGYCHSDFKEINKDTVYEILKKDKNKLITYNISKIYNPNLADFIADKVRDIWNRMLDGRLKITHDFYLKYFQLNIDKYRYKMKWDVVLLDEAQDTNDVTLDIFNKIPSSKKVMVGDIYQKIYGFRGSINAMEKWEADVELRLSITFRFHDSIAEEANKILSNMRRESVLIKAKGKPDKDLKTTAILSRTNSGLIEVADRLITEGKTFNTVRPVDEITRLPLSVLGFIRGDMNIREKWLYRFSSIDEVRKFAEEVNDIELLSAISIAENYKSDLYRIVNIMKGMENLNSDIYLSTAHSSKGLEWDKVIILDNYPDIIDKFVENKIYSLDKFHKMLKTGNKDALEVSEEINLMYVAITRAKKVLINKSKNQTYFEMPEKEFDKLLNIRKKTLQNKD